MKSRPTYGIFLVTFLAMWASASYAQQATLKNEVLLRIGGDAVPVILGDEQGCDLQGTIAATEIGVATLKTSKRVCSVSGEPQSLLLTGNIRTRSVKNANTGEISNIVPKSTAVTLK